MDARNRKTLTDIAQQLDEMRCRIAAILAQDKPCENVELSDSKMFCTVHGRVNCNVSVSGDDPQAQG